MKELTIEQKARAYDEAKARMSRAYNSNRCTIGFMNEIFPEFKDEDERIKEEIINYFECQSRDEPCRKSIHDKWIAWIEKQGQTFTKEEVGNANKVEPKDYNGIDPYFGKPVDKVEPKFKVGEWITDGQLTCKVLSVTGKSYELHLYNDDYCHFETDVQSVDKHYHLWTIQDTHDGDVLTSIGFHSNCTFILKGLDNWKFDEPNGDRAVATGYCCLSVSSDKMEFGIQGPDYVEVNTIKPATKIQRDLLFQKMKESGYEWDVEKKELKKIEQKPTDKVEPKFKAGNWYQCTKDFFGKGVTFDKNTAYYCAQEGCLQNEYGCHIAIVKDLYDNFKLWTIQDARDGDVLCCESGWTCIFKTLINYETFSSYCFMDETKWFCETGSECHTLKEEFIKAYNGKIYPATKEQRNNFFVKMKEAGYEWDAEKKKLKKIEDEIEIPFGAKDSELQEATYFIPKGFHAEINGDKVIIKKGEKPIAWSEEDEKAINDIMWIIEAYRKDGFNETHIQMADNSEKWLKSLEDRIGG